MGAVFVLLAVLFGALNPVWVKFAYLGGSTALALNFWQGFFAVILYLGVILVLGKERFRVSRKELIRFLILGSCGMFLTITLMNLSLQKLQASYTVMLFFCNPAFVLLGSFLFFKTRLRMQDGFVLLFILAGVFVLTRPQGTPNDLLGVILGIGSAVAQAFFILYSGHITKTESDPLKMSFYVQIGFFATSLLLSPLIGVQTLAVSAGMKYGLILAVLASLLTTVFLFKGVTLLGANRTALLTVINLPLSLVFTLLILKDEPTGHLLGGFILILAGLLIDAATRYYQGRPQKVKEDSVG